MNYCYSEESRQAILQLPSGSLGEPRQVDCSFQEMRGARLSIESPIPVPCTTAVSVKFEDAMYLGEVINSSQVNGAWHLDVHVEQILSGLTSLLALRKQLMSESVSTPLVGIPAHSRN